MNAAGEAAWQRLVGLRAANHTPHACHASARDWPESNCYVDVYVELLHALGLEVRACLSFTLASDFEGDQWTFFKPPLGELRDLYGLEVGELTLWRSLPEHVEEQLARRRIVLPEVDAFYLPDTAATDYRRSHVKTTIAIASMEVSSLWLAYFHNGGFHELSGEDWEGVFRARVPRPEGELPPYCEFVKLDHLVVRPEPELRVMARELARRHLSFAPRDPVAQWIERWPRDLAWLLSRDERAYHDYVFAGLRQLGASAEFTAMFLSWLDDAGDHGSSSSGAEASFREVSRLAKMLVLKLARIARSRKSADLRPALDELRGARERGMEALRAWL